MKFRIFRELKFKDRVYLVLASICSLIAGCHLPVVGFLLGQAVQALTCKTCDATALSTVNYRFAYVFMAHFAISACSLLLWNFLAQHGALTLRQKVVKKLFALQDKDFAYSWLSRQDLSVKLSSAFNTIDQNLVQLFDENLQHLSACLLSFALVFYMSWRLALCLFLLLPVSLAFAWLSLRWFRSLSNKIVNISLESRALADFAVDNLRRVQIDNFCSILKNKYADSVKSLIPLYIRQSIVAGSLLGALHLIHYFVYASTFLYAGYIFVPKDFTLGNLISSLFCMAVCSYSCNSLALSPANFKFCRNSVQHLVELFQQAPSDLAMIWIPPSRSSRLPQTAFDISFHCLSLSSCHMDAEFPANSLNVIIGEVDEVGKLFQDMAGMTDRKNIVPSTVLFGRTDLIAISTAELHQTVHVFSYSPTIRHPSLTVRDFLVLSRAFPMGLVMKACADTDCLDSIQNLPFGFDSMLDDCKSHLLLKRLYLARAVLWGRRALLIVGPYRNLSEYNQRAFHETLLKLKQHFTISNWPLPFYATFDKVVLASPSYSTVAPLDVPEPEDEAPPVTYAARQVMTDLFITMFRMVKHLGPLFPVVFVLAVTSGILAGFLVSCLGIIFSAEFTFFSTQETERLSYAVWNAIFCGVALGAFVSHVLQLSFMGVLMSYSLYDLRNSVFQDLLRKYGTVSKKDLHAKINNISAVTSLIGSLFGNAVQLISLAFGALLVSFGYSWQLSMLMSALALLFVAAVVATESTLTAFRKESSAACEKLNDFQSMIIQTHDSLKTLDSDYFLLDRYHSLIQTVKCRALLKVCSLRALSRSFPAFAHFVLFTALVYNRYDLKQISVVYISIILATASMLKLARVPRQELGSSLDLVKETIKSGDKKPGKSLSVGKPDGGFKTYAMSLKWKSFFAGGADLDAIAGQKLIIHDDSVFEEAYFEKMFQSELSFHNTTIGDASMQEYLKPVCDANRSLFYSKLSWIRVNPLIFPGSIKDNILGPQNEPGFDRIYRRLRVMSMVSTCKAIGIDEEIQKLPGVYDHFISERCEPIFKLKIALARSLFSGSTLILFEDVFSTCETMGDYVEMMKLVLKCSHKKTMLFHTSNKNLIPNFVAELERFATESGCVGESVRVIEAIKCTEVSL